MTIAEIDNKKLTLLDKVNKLAAIHKQKYGSIDISQPVSKEEKESSREIALIFSEIWELVRMKRKLKNQ